MRRALHWMLVLAAAKGRDPVVASMLLGAGIVHWRLHPEPPSRIP